MTAAEPPARERRDDLDGLRGLAIALVVCFHVFVARVSGGVDVFLTLSGWFFGIGLARTVVQGSPPSLGGTLLRLVRRLGPALVVTLAVTSALVVLVQPATWWRPIAAQVIASLAQVENWYLAVESRDYQAADGAVSPMQHLWTISVQVQVFLGMTAIVLAATLAHRLVRRARGLRPSGAPEWLPPAIYGALATASFAYATVVHAADPAWAYYDTAARAWEILVGAAAGVLIPRLVTSRRRPPAWLGRTLGFAGLAAVLSCGILLDGLALFPGPWTLIPVLATIAIVVAGMSGATGPVTVSWLLSRRLAVWLGGRAYTLYLWHWPLLVLLMGWTGWTSPPVWAGLVVIAVSLALAAATTRWVELPLRRRPVGPRTAAARAPRAAIMMLALVLVATSVAWSGYTNDRRAGDLDPASYPGARSLTEGWAVPDRPAQPDVLAEPLAPSVGEDDECVTSNSSVAVERCVFGEADSGRSLALIGGSHSRQWFSTLRTLAVRHEFRLVTYLKGGCRVAVGAAAGPHPGNGEDCRVWMADVLDQVVQEQPDYVFAPATQPEATRKSNGHLRLLVGDEAPDDFVEAWHRMTASGIRVLGLRDTPWLRDEAGDRIEPLDCLSSGGTTRECGVPRDRALDSVSPLLAHRDLAGFHPIDLSDGICGPQWCEAVVGNIVVYRDSSHITEEYAISLIPELQRQIGNATGWW